MQYNLKFKILAKTVEWARAQYSKTPVFPRTIFMCSHQHLEDFISPALSHPISLGQSLIGTHLVLRQMSLFY